MQVPVYLSCTEIMAAESSSTFNSLTALEYDGSVHSLPQLNINESGKEGVYPARTSKRAQSEECAGNTNTSGHEGPFPPSASMSNVR